MLMTITAVMLILLDSRMPLDGASTDFPSDSLPYLPLKRDYLRKFAVSQNIEMAGEVILELEKNINLDLLLDETIQKILKLDSPIVICADRNGLEQSGLYKALICRLEQKGIMLINPLASAPEGTML